MKIIMLLFIVVMSMACAKTEEPVIEAVQQQHEAVSKPAVANPYSGTYFFDVQKYRNVQMSQKASLFKDMKPEDVEKMMSLVPKKIEELDKKLKANL